MCQTPIHWQYQKRRFTFRLSISSSRSRSPVKRVGKCAVVGGDQHGLSSPCLSTSPSWLAILDMFTTNSLHRLQLLQESYQAKVASLGKPVSTLVVTYFWCIRAKQRDRSGTSTGKIKATSTLLLCKRDWVRSTWACMDDGTSRLCGSRACPSMYFLGPSPKASKLRRSLIFNAGSHPYYQSFTPIKFFGHTVGRHACLRPHVLSTLRLTMR